MDPLTIVGTVVIVYRPSLCPIAKSLKVSLIASSAATARALFDLQSKYTNAPTTIVAICSEAAVIGASLSQIQTLLFHKSESAGYFESRPELADVLDVSLTGCTVVLSCLDEEIRRMPDTPVQTTGFTLRNKARVVWNQDKLRDLLESLRGQQTAINLLIQLLQM